MWKFALLGIVLTSVFIFLYNMGYMVINSKSAVSYVGSTKGTGATFTSCNGYIKRIIRFQEDKTCTFLLHAELTKGDMSVELLDSAKHKIMCLTRSAPSAVIDVVKNKKYYLVINFKSATGRYSLLRE